MWVQALNKRQGYSSLWVHPSDRKVTERVTIPVGGEPVELSEAHGRFILSIFPDKLREVEADAKPIALEDEEEARPETPEAGTYKCQVAGCRKRPFKSKAALNSHLRVHNKKT